MEMTEKIYLETLKSVQGCSISHYSAREKIGQSHLMKFQQTRKHHSQMRQWKFRSVITVDVIRTVSIIHMIELNWFIFQPVLHKIQFYQANILQFQLLFSNGMLVAHTEPQAYIWINFTCFVVVILYTQSRFIYLKIEYLWSNCVVIFIKELKIQVTMMYVQFQKHLLHWSKNYIAIRNFQRN